MKHLQIYPIKGLDLNSEESKKAALLKIFEKFAETIDDKVTSDDIELFEQLINDSSAFEISKMMISILNESLDGASQNQTHEIRDLLKTTKLIRGQDQAIVDEICQSFSKEDNTLNYKELNKRLNLNLNEEFIRDFEIKLTDYYEMHKDKLNKLYISNCFEIVATDENRSKDYEDQASHYLKIAADLKLTKHLNKTIIFSIIESKNDSEKSIWNEVFKPFVNKIKIQQCNQEKPVKKSLTLKKAFVENIQLKSKSSSQEI